MKRDEILFKSIFESAVEGLIICNNEGEILMANKRAEILFGYQEDELVGQKIEILVPDDLKSIHKVHRKEYAKAPTQRMMGANIDLFGKRKDGSTFPIEISLNHSVVKGQPLVVSFIIDITARKKMEKDLEKNRNRLEKYSIELEERVRERTLELERSNMNLLASQRLFRTIAKNFPNGTINVIDKNFNYIFVEGKELKAKGINSKDLIGKPYVHNNEDSELEQKLNDAFIGQNSTHEVISGTEHYMIYIVPLPSNHNTDIERILIVEKNITKQKNAEENIRSALKKERELNELKSRFVSMASHEFRTPLSTILSSASLLDKYFEVGNLEKKDKHISKIKSSVNNLINLLNDFLSLDKIEEGVITPSFHEFNLKKLIEEIIEELSDSLKPGQDIIFKYSYNEHVILDKQLVKNIFINLISNAIKYSNAEKPIHVSVYKENSLIIFEVSDEGIGIPKDDMEHLFGRFFRAHNATNIEGTGLGLNIVKKYVEMMGGQISCVSEEGFGTTFKIFLNEKVKEELS
ncbi:sensor histidine kinase [Marinigracilibium pacificum]|uniref:histidine kinase n=1 Tax=Marinigracilibium pacificum TaxID=2729599 RepID=A0A848IXK2_9BACT|nr:PAS domain S-box protein [Marinigracilibium pacificum]NMM46974.1 PAS domain S-box protein [Marinigracilibium pacificum]